MRVSFLLLISVFFFRRFLIPTFAVETCNRQTIFNVVVQSAIYLIRFGVDGFVVVGVVLSALQEKEKKKNAPLIKFFSRSYLCSLVHVLNVVLMCVDKKMQE